MMMQKGRRKTSWWRCSRNFPNASHGIPYPLSPANFEQQIQIGTVDKVILQNLKVLGKGESEECILEAIHSSEYVRLLTSSNRQLNWQLFKFLECRKLEYFMSCWTTFAIGHISVKMIKSSECNTHPVQQHLKDLDEHHLFLRFQSLDSINDFRLSRTQRLKTNQKNCCQSSRSITCQCHQKNINGMRFQPQKLCCEDIPHLVATSSIWG